MDTREVYQKKIRYNIFLTSRNTSKIKSINQTSEHTSWEMLGRFGDWNAWKFSELTCLNAS